NESTQPVFWSSLNGAVGPSGLGVVQFNGLALSPTSADEAIGNIGDATPVIHNAVRFSDRPNLGNAAYGWTTVDANGLDGEVGTGQVLYVAENVNRSTIYRVSNSDSGGDATYIRRSDDGGVTWVAATAGIGNQFNFVFVPSLVSDPSRPLRLLTGFDKEFATEDRGVSWNA